MNKKIYILNDSSGTAGVAKIKNNGKNSVLSIILEQNIPGRKNCRILSGSKFIDIGNFYKNKTEFEIPKDIVIDNIIIEENGNVLAWSGEKPSHPTEERHISETEKVTFDNFLGGGFDWHRIRGNFIMFDYSIIHHILSIKEVYQAINRAGYYCAGIRKEENLTIIAIAVPLIKNTGDPFSSVSADKYTIHSGKTDLIALCVGIDETGEFFISF